MKTRNDWIRLRVQAKLHAKRAPFLKEIQTSVAGYVSGTKLNYIGWAVYAAADTSENIEQNHRSTSGTFTLVLGD